MTEQMRDADILIAGGGYVGLSLAVALKQAAPDMTIIVADGRPRPDFAGQAGSGDERASAIAASARRLLEVLGVFEPLADHAQPILDMVVTDSRTTDAVRPVFLSFDGEVEPGEPFAHMIPNTKLVQSLLDRADALGVILDMPCRIVDFAESAAGMIVNRDKGEPIRAQLLIAADGVRSALRDIAGIKTISWAYRQKAIVTTLAHTRPHNGRAEEHFFPAGPLALLPLTGNRSSLVWTERPEKADRLVAGDEDVFLMELESRTGFHLGEFSLAGPRQAYPLGLTLVREFVRPRFALVGDAAHGIHPIAGQGLNMGFRDVAALSEVIIETRRLGLDIGSVTALERYQQWRRFDTWQMGAVTDGLNRLFSNDSRIIRGVRDIGLSLVDRMPGLKTAFIKEAAGTTGDLPKLMRGQEI